MGGPVDRPGGAGQPRLAFHPHFLFAAAKRKRRWSRQKKKRWSLRSYGRGAPCRAAGRGSKRSCSVDAASTGARAGLSPDLRTLYAVLNSEGIGQRLNLTSSSFRAFRFAKRCPGSRGRLPFRSVGADDLGGPNPRPPSIEKRTDSHVGPLGLLGMIRTVIARSEATRQSASPVP